MGKSKLTWQLLFPYLLITFFSLVAITWFSSRPLRSLYYEESKESLTARASLLRAEVAELIKEKRFDDLQNLAVVNGKQTETRITVILPDGKVVADSHKNPEQMENHAHRPEIATALKGTQGSSTRVSPTLDLEMLYVAIPLNDGESRLGILRTAFSVSKINTALNFVYFKFLMAVLVVAIIGSVLIIAIVRRFTEPLEEMKKGADRFAQGDFSAKLPVPSSEEVGGLAEALNEMARQLDDRIRIVEKQKNENDAVLTSMVEGVIAVDADEKVISMNQAAKRFIDSPEQESIGKDIQEVVRNISLQSFIKNTLNATSIVEDNLIMRDSYNKELHLQGHGSVLKDASGKRIGALVVLNEVTRLKQLETVRQDFVANVSHELKTPITAIKGFVETLQDGAIRNPEEAERFLGIVARQADRLNAIIEDLLTLSRIEKEEHQNIELTNSLAAPVVEAAIQDCRMEAAKKSINIKTEVPKTLRAQMNPHLLEQALVNLINNAIKYSEAGSKVLIQGNATAEEVVLSVQDWGSGISNEHQARLFERFYRVDKARSRNLGGTGLGLAIVKHIVQAHGGIVEVNSSPGKGSIFSLHLQPSSMAEQTTKVPSA